jgi:hypothetical protein
MKWQLRIQPTLGAIFKRNSTLMKYLISAIILIIFIGFGLPDEVLYAKEGFIKWLPPLLIFFGLPFLIYKTLNAYKLRSDISFGIAIGSILIIGPLFGIWTGNLSDKDLDKNGVLIEGIVIEKNQVRKHRSRNYEWLYRAEFKVSDEYFLTYSEEDKGNTVNEGDTVIIKYSKRNPKNNTIIRLK